jgi:hypothetical protein
MCTYQPVRLKGQGHEIITGLKSYSLIVLGYERLSPADYHIFVYFISSWPFSAKSF